MIRINYLQKNLSSPSKSAEERFDERNRYKQNHPLNDSKFSRYLTLSKLKQIVDETKNYHLKPAGSNYFVNTPTGQKIYMTIKKGVFGRIILERLK